MASRSVVEPSGDAPVRTTSKMFATIGCDCSHPVVDPMPIAAAIAWLVLNIGYITIEMTILHRRLLPGELRAWYMTDVGKPALAAVVTVLVAWMLSPDAEFGRAGAVAMLAGVVALATIAATLVTPLPRAWLSRHSRSLRAVSL